MPKARSVLVLAGLLALWAELPPASAQNVTTKAGVCPDPATTEAVNCTVGCQSDGDCESTLKCCPAACGKACQKPDGEQPQVMGAGVEIFSCKSMDVNLHGRLKGQNWPGCAPGGQCEKPGTCPPVSPGIPMLGVCTNQCKTDSNCSGSQKCCRNGCGKVSCVTPLH